MGNTIKLHRVLKASPEKLYRAFTTAAIAKWIPPYGFTCTVHEQNVKVGGTYRMSFTNFTTQKSHSFGGKYVELVPGEKLRYSDKEGGAVATLAEAHDGDEGDDAAVGA